MNRILNLKDKKNEKGQVELEFILLMPFFLLLVFSVLSLAFLVINARLTTYATFMGARTASVRGDDPKAGEAAQSVLPGINLNVNNGGNSSLSVNGTYNFKPLIGKTGDPGDVLNTPVSDITSLTKIFQVHRFQAPMACDPVTNDNPIGAEACNSSGQMY